MAASRPGTHCSPEYGHQRHPAGDLRVSLQLQHRQLFKHSPFDVLVMLHGRHTVPAASCCNLSSDGSPIGHCVAFPNSHRAAEDLLSISSSNLKLPMPSVESAFVQGYNRVAVNAALNTSQSVLEIAGSWVVLAAMPAAPRGRLAALGAVSIACASLFAIVGVCFLLKADWTRLTGPHSPSTFPVDFDALTRSAALVSNHSVRSHPL